MGVSEELSDLPTCTIYEIRPRSVVNDLLRGEVKWRTVVSKRGSNVALTRYDTLGVPRDASRAEITAAFRTQMRPLHGDAGGDDALAKCWSSAHNVLTRNAEVHVLW